MSVKVTINSSNKSHMLNTNKQKFWQIVSTLAPHCSLNLCACAKNQLFCKLQAFSKWKQFTELNLHNHSYFDTDLRSINFSPNFTNFCWRQHRKMTSTQIFLYFWKLLIQGNVWAKFQLSGTFGSKINHGGVIFTPPPSLSR